jgi:acetylornithine deacetylase/succinyl-diaminopimelate desuccinylase-like protein
MTETPALDDALRYAADHRGETLADLVELSKIPSISAAPSHAGDVRAAAEWCAKRLRALGMSLKIVEGRVHPVVLAEWMGRADAPTLGVYNHFDVQPPDPLDLWTTPPFTAAFGNRATLKRMGASVPVAADFQEALAPKMIVSGFSLPGDNFHSPDEHFALSHLHGGVDMLVRLASGLAEHG